MSFGVSIYLTGSFWASVCGLGAGVDCACVGGLDCNPIGVRVRVGVGSEWVKTLSTIEPEDKQ